MMFTFKTFLNMFTSAAKHSAVSSSRPNTACSRNTMGNPHAENGFLSGAAIVAVPFFVIINLINIIIANISYILIGVLIIVLNSVKYYSRSNSIYGTQVCF